MLFIIGYTVSTTTVWLVGVLVNVAIIWIYTSKNSRVNKSGQREFPLMFAAIDLFAVTLILPISAVFICFKNSVDFPFVLKMLLNLFFLFAMCGYLFCLITATVDKFYAVYFPFKYRFVHKTIIKIAIGLTFGFNAGINIGMQPLYLLENLSEYVSIIRATYGAMYILVLVTVIVMYVLIVVKIIQSQNKIGNLGRAELKTVTR